jgi:hypothetical protein
VWKKWCICGCFSCSTAHKHSVGSNTFNFCHGVRGWRWCVHNEHVVWLQWSRRSGRRHWKESKRSAFSKG